MLSTVKGHTSRVFSVSFAPDNRTAATASFDGTVKIWDTMRAVETEIFDRHPGHFAKVHFSADGRFLSRSVASAKQVTLWNTRSWQKIAVIPQRESGFFGNDARLGSRGNKSRPLRLLSRWAFVRYHL
jgi:WD40 repeat protein